MGLAYLEAKDDPQLLKVFWNTSLGLPYDGGVGKGYLSDFAETSVV